jgi:hypothetical protein
MTRNMCNIKSVSISFIYEEALHRDLYGKLLNEPHQFHAIPPYFLKNQFNLLKPSGNFTYDQV